MEKLILILLVGAGVSLSACTSGVKKQPPESFNLSKKIALKGHIQPKKAIHQVLNKGGVAPIPSLAGNQAVIFDPNIVQNNLEHEKYSVSAINVPVTDLLYNLAVDANKELDLSARVTGNVTVNAINQPLISILQRISEQVGAVFNLEQGLITVRKDMPYWHTYRVDHVNISKEVKDTMVLKMSVGSVGGTQGGKAEASEFETRSTAKYDVWASLYDNIKAMATQEDIINKQVVTSQDFNKKIKDDNGEQVKRNIESNTTSNKKITSQKEIVNVVLNREAGLISAKTTRKQHYLISNYIDSIVSRTTRQVLIEATVIEVALNDKYQAGVDWSAANSSSSGSGSVSQKLLGSNYSDSSAFSINLSSFGDFSFDLGIKMLQQFGDAKVLSSPKIMALNNQSALLKVVDNEVYFTISAEREAATATSSGFVTYSSKINTVPVGFMMNMTPFISDSDDVTIKIRPTLSRIVGYVNDPNPALAQENIVNRVPIIQEREMDSILRLKNRQTAILGGLIQDKRSQDRTGVPGLSSIPLLGDLFSYRSDEVIKSELIIFIRPIIISNPDVDNGDLKQLKYYLKSKTI